MSPFYQFYAIITIITIILFIYRFSAFNYCFPFILLAFFIYI